MNKLIYKILALSLFFTQLSLAAPGKSGIIHRIAQPTACISANFTATGSTSWKTISLKLTNNCGQPIDFQSSIITFTDASALNTTFWGNFSPLSYPDNTLQITSQAQSGGSYLATMNLHFPTTSGSNSILPKAGSFTIIYGAPSADYVASSVNVYLKTTPNTGEIDLTNTSPQPADLSQAYAPVQLTLNGQVIATAQVPWSGTQKITGLAAGTYIISPVTITDNAGNNYIGTANPQSITLTAGSVLGSAINYTMVQQTGAITINTQALPGPITGYSKNPTVTLTNATTGSVLNTPVNWNSTTTIPKLANGNSYTLSSATIIYNGYSCIPMFTPSSVPANATPNSSNLTYTCTQLAQAPVTLNVSGAPSLTSSIPITLTPNDGSAPIVQTINLSNGSGSTTVSLTMGGIYTVSTTPLSGYSVSFNPQPLGVSANSTESITFTSSHAAVSGWPQYLAMGAVTDDSTGTQTSLQSRPVDALFKYAGLGGNGDPGQIVYPIFDMETAEQAQALTSYYHKNGIPNTVMPNMVVYTAQMSGGTSFTDFEYTNMVMHYINLIMETQKLQSYQTAQMTYPASIILNPDLLGMLQQQNLILQANAAIGQVSIANALATAVCFATYPLDTTYGKGLNYEQLFEAIRAQSTDNWSAINIWDSYKMQYFNICNASPTVPTSITIPSFTNDLPGWAQSTNWLIRQFGPNITFGWQVNLWGIGSSNWVHQNYSAATLKSAVSDPTVALIESTSIYSGAYKPDFIVFDKYEMDSIPGAVGLGYLFNSRDWSNVLNYVKNISQALGNVPVMLWQIPGGHLQQTNDIDTRNSHAATEPDFFFGDSNNPLNSLRPYITSISLSSAIYGTTNISTYLMMDPTGSTNTYTWQSSNLQQAVNSNVFAILWGGGNTTSVGSFPSDDHGWLAGKIMNYYQNPINLPLKK